MTPDIPFDVHCFERCFHPDAMQNDVYANMIECAKLKCISGTWSEQDNQKSAYT